MRQAQVVSELVADDAHIEIAVADPNARTANVRERAEDQERFCTGENDVEIEVAGRIAGSGSDLANVIDELNKIVVVGSGWLGQPQGVGDDGPGLRRQDIHQAVRHVAVIVAQVAEQNGGGIGGDGRTHGIGKIDPVKEHAFVADARRWIGDRGRSELRAL